MTPKSDYWPCACMKRKGGVLTAIKLNHPTVKRCRVCGCKQSDGKAK